MSSRRAALVQRGGIGSAAPVILARWSAGTTGNAEYRMTAQETHTEQAPPRNFIFQLGYNPARVDTTEPALVLQWESDFDSGSGRLAEFHLAYDGADGTGGHRVFTVAINRATHNSTVAMRYDALSFTRRDTGAETVQISNTQFVIRSGVTLDLDANNVSFLRQKTAGGGWSALLNLNASDQLNLVPSGAAVVLGGNTIYVYDGGTANAKYGLGLGASELRVIGGEGGVGIGYLSGGAFQRRIWVDSVGVVLGSQNSSADALLRLDSTVSGFLPPRMTAVQRDAISSPTDGLVIYNSTAAKLQVRAGAAWVDLH